MWSVCSRPKVLELRQPKTQSACGELQEGLGRLHGDGTGMGGGWAELMGDMGDPLLRTHSSVAAFSNSREDFWGFVTA